MNLLLTTIGDAAVILTALITTLVVIIYAFRSRFEESEPGKLLLQTFICLALILDYTAVRTISRIGTVISASSATLIIRITIFTTIGIIMLRWLIQIIHLQSLERKNR